MADPFNIVFMGTPDFAVPALNTLNENHFNISLVITQPDRPKGRGRKRIPPPVKISADNLRYDIIQPESIKTKSVYDQIAALRPDFFVVVAFGHILSEDLLALPKIDALNIHPSLLPKYRGPAPIQRAILNMEKETGVTIMSLDKGMDSGDILMQKKINISQNDTAGTLHESLATLGADLLINTLKNFKKETINRIPQDHSKATSAPLFKKKDGHINWSRSAEQLEAFIRGMTPWPGAFTFLNKNRIKIFKARPAPISETAPPGTVIKGFENELRIATGDGALSIVEIQGASGKRLDIQNFLRGTKVTPGTMLT